MNVDDSPDNNNHNDDANDSNVATTAYWIQRTVREAIYGRVFFAVVLRRRPWSVSRLDGAEWEVTTDHCAVKEMSWQHIRRERDRLAEDPIKEVSAMQYVKRWYEQQQQQQQKRPNEQLLPPGRPTASGPFPMTIIPPQGQPSNNNNNNTPSNNNNDDDEADVSRSFRAMRETNIMMPLDLLSDERNLYSIMPYCDGGELFERLDVNERFSEDEARYWMDQVLNVRSSFACLFAFFCLSVW
jgi:serine/threonine protein kinase